MDFKKSFCWRSNLSNGDIISVLCDVNMQIVTFCDLLQVGKRVWKLTSFGLK